VVGVILVLRLAFPLPEGVVRSPSTALQISPETALGARVGALAKEHPDLSGVLPLRDGRDAYSARVLLARTAQESIDVQYYIWQTDTTGWLLLDELLDAAERGVRVRLLLDDNGIPGLDDVVAAFDALPNAEVRIFNPFTLRQPKLVSYLFDFPRLNRRMHNKSMTVDGALTIVGGRNIGDIYFAYGAGAHYFDLDVLLAGPAAADVASEFDLYWASESAYPASAILAPAPAGLDRLRSEAKEAEQSVIGSGYLKEMAESKLVADLLTGAQKLEWTSVTLVSDDPAKGLGKAEDADLLVRRLPQLLDQPKRSIDLVSAYFVPGRQGVDLLAGNAARGLEVRVLTNAMEATDVAPVHSAYMKYRRELLEDGVEVLELTANPSAPETDTSLQDLISGSSSSLHAKTFAIDKQRIFIGSFNFDPRSAALNTEMGFMIDSPTIAGELSQSLDNSLTHYSVVLTEDADLEWIKKAEDGSVTTYDVEPNTTAFQRAIVRFMSWLPIEWML